MIKHQKRIDFFIVIKSKRSNSENISKTCSSTLYFTKQGTWSRNVNDAKIFSEEVLASQAAQFLDNAIVIEK